MCCNRNNFVNNGCYRNSRNTCWNSWWYQNCGCQSTGNMGLRRLWKQRKRWEPWWLRLRNSGNAGTTVAVEILETLETAAAEQRERWKQRLWKYRKHWKLWLHRQRRMLDGGVLQRSVVDHPVPGRKIRVQDGITETKRRAGGCASPCLLHIGQEPGRKTAGEKEEGLYEQKENGTDGWHRASYSGRGGAGNGRRIRYM